MIMPRRICCLTASSPPTSSKPSRCCAGCRIRTTSALPVSSLAMLATAGRCGVIETTLPLSFASKDGSSKVDFRPRQPDRLFRLPSGDPRKAVAPPSRPRFRQTGFQCIRTGQEAPAGQEHLPAQGKPVRRCVAGKRFPEPRREPGKVQGYRGSCQHCKGRSVQNSRVRAARWPPLNSGNPSPCNFHPSPSSCYGPPPSPCCFRWRYRRSSSRN